MGSTFRGLSEFVNNAKALEQSNISDHRILFIAQVLNVITGEDLEQASLDGTLDDAGTGNNYPLVGAIRYKQEAVDDNKYEDAMYRIAYPADRSNMRLPVPGELVLIMAVQSDSNTPQRKVELYTNVVTGADMSRYAAKPEALTAIDNRHSNSGSSCC